MYAPNSVPEGPHHIYIFQDQTRPWFKIGESRSPDDRIKNVTWEHPSAAFEYAFIGSLISDNLSDPRDAH